MIQSKDLAVEATSMLSSGKELAFNDIQSFTVKLFYLKDNMSITLMVKPQKCLLKAMFLLN